MATIIEFIFLPTRVTFQAFSQAKTLVRKSVERPCGPLAGVGLRYVITGMELREIDSIATNETILSICAEAPQKLNPEFLVADANNQPGQPDAFLEEAFQRLPLSVVSGSNPAVSVDRVINAQAGCPDQQGDGVEFVSIADGEVFSLPAQTRITAIDDSVIGVPMSIFDGLGEKKIGAMIHPDTDVKLGMTQSGHPVVGPCVIVALVAGKSVWLSKTSQVVVGASPGDNRSCMRFKLAPM